MAAITRNRNLYCKSKWSRLWTPLYDNEYMCYRFYG